MGCFCILHFWLLIVFHSTIHMHVFFAHSFLCSTSLHFIASTNLIQMKMSAWHFVPPTFQKSDNDPFVRITNVGAGKHVKHLEQGAEGQNWAMVI